MKFHPDSELLLKYASGQLDAPLSLAIALHQQKCDECQYKISELESIGGQTLDSCDNDKTISLNFEHLIQAIDSLPKQNIETYHEIAIAESDLDIFEKLNNNNFQNMLWKKVTRNIRQANIAMNDPQYEVVLYDLSPNTKVPKHTHQGNEFTLILQGDFSDKNGQYKQGSFISQDESDEHQPIAGDQGCICLAITNAPLKYTGTFGRVLNWF